MGKNTKILFTDLDGTLLNDEKEVTAGNQAAIDRALEQGHKIVVTTGRPLASGLDIAERIGLTKEGCYVIAFNGGQIYDPFHKKTIYGKTFSKEVAKPLFQEAMDRGLHIQSYSDTQVLSLKENRELLFYISGSTVSYKIVPDLESAFPNDPYKILLVGLDNRAELDRYQEECVNRKRILFYRKFSGDRSGRCFQGCRSKMALRVSGYSPGKFSGSRRRAK